MAEQWEQAFACETNFCNFFFFLQYCFVYVLNHLIILIICRWNKIELMKLVEFFFYMSNIILKVLLNSTNKQNLRFIWKQNQTEKLEF